MQFRDIIGQEELKRHLVRNVDTGRISHAQLFTGAAGRGTLALAVAYVQYLNCTNRHDGDSCGTCPSCRQLAELAHPDLHWVFPVNKQGKKSGETVLSDDFLPLFRKLFIERKGYFSPRTWYDRLDLGKTLKGIITAKEADRVIEKLALKSFGGAYKSVIVWLPEAMNEEAANKLLKILEEPWDRTLFLLVSEQPDRLLKTILSRTQEVAVPRLTLDTLTACAREAGIADPAKARNLARLADGDRLELSHLLDGNEDTQRKTNFQLFCSLMRLSYNDKHLELITWAEEAAQLTREQQLALLRDSVRLLRESYMLHAGLGEISYLWGEEAEFCRKFAPFIGNDNIEPLVAEMETAMTQLGQNGNPTIVFTHFALSVSKMIKKLKYGAMATAVLITGGNRGDVRARLAEARRLAGELIGEVKRASACHESAPWGFEADEPFWNQVLEVETPLTPRELLAAVHAIERRLGRDREAERAEKERSGQAYASRTIDVDILLYDDLIVREPDLQIPHPRMGGREFVLRPLCELMSERRHPESGKTMRELLDALKKQ